MTESEWEEQPDSERRTILMGPLKDQLCELAKIANERGMGEAASLLQSFVGRRMMVFRPGEGESARFDPIQELFFRDIRRQNSEGKPDPSPNRAENYAGSARAAGETGELTLREGCEALVREWTELGDIGLSAKVASQQLRQLLTAVEGS